MEIRVKTNDELIKESKVSKMGCMASWVVGCFCITLGFITSLDIYYWVGLTMLFVANLYSQLLFSNIIRLEVRGGE